ncbi:MAG: DUF4350 domain-containing protein [Clostridia bacterium]|nr:DUF4350 domain-containing protein [Clostridia bacterium]
MKIKKLLPKTILFLLVGVIIIAITLFLYNQNRNKEFQPYSTLNPKGDGTKALYLLTNQMGFNAGRYKRTARLLPDKATLVVIKPYHSLFHDEMEKKYLKKWLEKGNKIVLIDDEAFDYGSSLNSFEGEVDQRDEDFTVYTVGEGKIYEFTDPEDFTNRGIRNSMTAAKFIDVLEDLGNRRILFNEYYHGLSAGDITVWDLLSQAQKLMVIQGILSLILLTYIISRRFGKPVTVFEIIKRQENENLFALSNVYIKARANSLALETYFNNFKKEITKYLGFTNLPDDQELLKAASGNRFLNELQFKDVYLASRNYIDSDNNDRKLLVYLLEKIEDIRKGIK